MTWIKKNWGSADAFLSSGETPAGCSSSNNGYEPAQCAEISLAGGDFEILLDGVHIVVDGGLIAEMLQLTPPNAALQASEFRRIQSARDDLYVANLQISDSDDDIIVGHMRAALTLLDSVLADERAEGERMS